MSGEPLSPPARPTWRKSAEGRWLAIKLRRDSTGRLLASYHVPEYGPLGEPVPLSPETLASLAPSFQFDGVSGLLGLNRLLDQGSEAELERWLTGAAVTGERGLGSLLYRTLFPSEETEHRVLAHLFQSPSLGHSLSPIRYGVQVRICTTEPDLVGLPWLLTSWRGHPLIDNGWTFAVTPELPEDRAVQLPGLSRILILAPQVKNLPDLGTAAHIEELRTRLRHALPAQADDDHFLVVHTKPELARALSTMAFDVFYYFGHGCIEQEQVCLQLGESGSSRGYLTFADLKRMMHESFPLLALLNGCFTGAAGWQGAGHLLSPQVPVVVCNRTKAFARYASAFAVRWLHDILIGRLEPLDRLHLRHAEQLEQSQHDFQWATYTAYASYTSWDPAQILVHSRDPRSPFRLDRSIARAQVVDQVSALLESRSRRVEALVAYAGDHNLLDRFGWQATDHLERRKVAPTFRLELKFPRERSELDSQLSDAFSQQAAAEREPISHALRRHAPRVPSAKKPVLWLDWGVCGGEQQEKLNLEQLRLWLKWCSAFLGRHCPDDIRIVSYLALRIDPSKHEALRHQAEEYKDELNSQRFRAFFLQPLPKVDRSELKEFISDPDNTSCPDNPRTILDATNYIYRDTDGHYEEIIAHLRWAEEFGWQNLIDKLRRKHDPHLAAAKPAEDID